MGLTLQQQVRPFWVSWVQKPELSEYELHSPWWTSGQAPHPDGTRFTICAAVMAESVEAAKNKILDAYDVRPTDLEWRFCEERPNNWTPFSERFPRAAWMRWPNAPDQRPGGKEA